MHWLFDRAVLSRVYDFESMMLVSHAFMSELVQPWGIQLVCRRCRVLLQGELQSLEVSVMVRLMLDLDFHLLDTRV